MQETLFTDERVVFRRFSFDSESVLEVHVSAMSQQPSRSRGRPKTDKETVTIAVRLEPALVGELDEYAEASNLKPNRSQVIRMLLRQALDSHKQSA